MNNGISGKKQNGSILVHLNSGFKSLPSSVFVLLLLYVSGIPSKIV